MQFYHDQCQDALRIHPETRAADAEADAAANRALDAVTDSAMADALGDAPTYEVFEPAPDDAAEAAALFGELSTAEEVVEFEVWLDGLSLPRFQEVTRAIDVLRGALAEYRGDLGVHDLARRID